MSEKKLKKQKGGLVDPGVNIFGNFPLLTTPNKPNIYTKQQFDINENGTRKTFYIREPMKKFFTNKDANGNNLKVHYRPKLFKSNNQSGGNEKNKNFKK